MTVKKRKKKSSPLLNKLIRRIKNTVNERIVDIPDLTPEQKAKVAKFIKELIVECVSESVSKTVKGKLDDKLS